MENLRKSGYLCSDQQMYTLRRVDISEGRAKGTSVIEVSTANGLQVDILPDSGLDIGQVRFKGINMSYICQNGYDSPARFIPYENEFLNTFPGGLMYTAGLRSTGPAHRDGEEWHPLHGRYHGIAAEQISTFMENDVITVSGTVRETALFGPVLELKRTIKIPVFGTKITISDKITNLTHKEEEYALLYHCNFGYPFVCADSYTELPKLRKTTPRTEFAASGLGKETAFSEPVPGEEERVFFHENMKHCASIVNNKLPAKMTLQWSENLPVLAHWKSMASGNYVCGLEPTNCYIMGRKNERENGTLPVLKPFETVETEISFCFE